MTDELGPMDITTNGTHSNVDADTSASSEVRTRTFSTQSVDERLQALLHTIRTWDWRAAPADASPPPADLAASTAVPESPAVPSGLYEAVALSTTDALAAATVAPSDPLPTMEDVEARAGVEPTPTVAPLDSFVPPPPPISTNVAPEPTIDPWAAAAATHFATTVPTERPQGVPPIRTPLESSPETAPPTTANPPVASTAAPPSPTTETGERAVPSSPAPAPWVVPIPPPPQTMPTSNAVPDAHLLGNGRSTLLHATAPQPAIGEPPTPVTVFPPPPAEDRTGITPEASSWFDAQPQPEPERFGVVHRLWSHPWAKVGLLCLVAALVVVLVIGGIRLGSKNNGASSGSPTTTTTAQHVTNHVAPITPAQLAQYEGYAAGFQTANETATRGFIAAGSAPTATKVAPIVANYRVAVNLYDFQLHWIPWPASMQTAITVDHAQLKALLSVLTSFPQVSPTGVSAWLAQMHDRSGTAQTADNQIRQDLGLPATSAFP